MSAEGKKLNRWSCVRREDDPDVDGRFVFVHEAQRVRTGFSDGGIVSNFSSTSAVARIRCRLLDVTCEPAFIKRYS